MNSTMSHELRSAMADAGNTTSVEVLYATGHWLFTQDRFSDAAAVFRVMLHAAPQDERPWLALGECHEAISQLNLAAELYATGTIAAAPAPRCALARARVLRKLDRTAEADDAFEKALELAEDAGEVNLAALVRRDAGAS